jgi:hypothetical protein
MMFRTKKAYRSQRNEKRSTLAHLSWVTMRLKRPKVETVNRAQLQLIVVQAVVPVTLALARNPQLAALSARRRSDFIGLENAKAEPSGAWKHANAAVPGCRVLQHMRYSRFEVLDNRAVEP